MDLPIEVIYGSAIVITVYIVYKLIQKAER